MSSGKLDNAPLFKVGDEVVCIDDSGPKTPSYYKFINKIEVALKKGKTYIIKGVKKECCGWSVDVGITLKDLSSNILYCSRCNKTYRTNDSDIIHWLKQERFAPIQRNKTKVEIEEGVLNAYPETKETVEPLVKEKVN